MITALFGVSGSGRILVPVNFRLVAEEVSYIVEHSGARLLLVDPELDDALSSVKCERRYVIGAETDDELLRFGVEPAPGGRRGRHGDDQLHVGHDGATEGRATDPPQHLAQRHDVRVAHVTDRDVYLHTLPQFHCNGWGMLYAVTGMGGQHIVLRKVDGAEILRRAEPRRDADVRRPGRRQHGARCGEPVGGRDPRPRVSASSSPAPPPTRTIERAETELGWSSTRSTASPRPRRC